MRRRNRPTAAAYSLQAPRDRIRRHARSRLPLRRTAPVRHARDDRSEEHTSELQSLMRISYAVFCLKKKNQISPITSSINTISLNSSDLQMTPTVNKTTNT